MWVHRAALRLPDRAREKVPRPLRRISACFLIIAL
jgi:hypothetical protein